MDAISMAAALLLFMLPVAAQDILTQARIERSSEILIRIFKQESQLELWMKRDGRFELLESYPICH
jgi:murein L,D-transpeptidase YafK